APETFPVGPMVVVSDVNVAVTVVALVGETVQVPVPEQPPPDQPAKTEPAPGVAVRTTELPDGKIAEQVMPHVIPAGALVTLPLPAPARPTVTATGARPTPAPPAVAAATATVP